MPEIAGRGSCPQVGQQVPPMGAQMNGGLMAAIQAEILAQPEADRLDYALDMLRFYVDPLPEFVQGCRSLGLRLAEAEVRILNALDRRRGSTVTRGALLAVSRIDSDDDDLCEDARLTRRIYGIRRCVERHNLPVRLMVHRGLGYQLDAAEGFRFDAPALLGGARHA